jgi:CheY-like chemotaxis protein
MEHLGKKIVIVEDDPLLMRAYHDALVAEGYTVESFFNADEAYAAVQAAAEKPALILSDIMMPKTNGLQFLEMIRASEMKDVPFILITSLAQQEHQNKAHALGVSAYLVKEEITIKDLIQKIKELAH